MLNWSNQAYKMTMGIGTMGIAGLMAEMWQSVLPAWLGVAVAIVPIGGFVFFRTGEMKDRYVRFAHVASSVWYLAVAVVLACPTAHPPKDPGGILCSSVSLSAERPRGTQIPVIPSQDSRPDHAFPFLLTTLLCTPALDNACIGPVNRVIPPDK